ncbi:MAG: helicase C-terminal domain-containing protein [Nitrospirota bacterium]
MNDIKAAFSILKKTFPDYEHRPQQVEMAEAVLNCLTDRKRLLVEAGTGVGKSFAYLIPALLSNEKTIISTASIALQDQLINKDLVFLQKVMPQTFSFAMLKGKNNYLCLKREREFSELTESFLMFREWVSETETGDRDELDFIPDFWPDVCGDSNDCGVNKCAFYQDCFYYAHYRKLYKKDITVVNHHLLVYDLVSGFNILPFHDQLIIDEAHQMENVISHVCGSALNHTQILWLLHRLRGLKIETGHLFDPVEKFFKNPVIQSFSRGGFTKEMSESLDKLKEQMAFDKVIHRLNLFRDSAEGDELRDRLDTTIAYINSIGAVIDDFIARDNGEKVYYTAVNRKSLELKSSLVECRMPFVDLINGYESVIMTSATLTAGGSFGFIRERLGITDFMETVIDSPFDFSKQALLYIDKDLPSPVKENSRSFQEGSLKVIEELISASMGRALVLFTSYAHLRFVSENIKTECPFKSQGDMPPARLIKWFKDTDNSVLLATSTFWQGIDIKGEDLSLVVIVKLPFGSPGDPVYDEKCRRLGDRWFPDLALPSAILSLRQGIGRLIRGSGDYGVNAILDTRLIRSFYGKTIISSLPDMKVVHSVRAVKEFFERVPGLPEKRGPELKKIMDSR